jgi:2-(1,2-epoxy-1,2-dihydrophenyl)acetyl-CoA isomerase
MNYETIQLEMLGTVGLITLNRPASLNALTTEVGQEFQAAVADVQQRGARAVVLTGAGRAFCAGVICERCRKLPSAKGKLKRSLTNH